MLSGTLGASFFGNMLSGKETRATSRGQGGIRAAERTVKVR